MTSNSLLDQGIVAVKEGRVDEARRQLKHAVKRDDTNWKAWFWLSRVAETDEERRLCLENVLTITPGNRAAREALQTLTAEKEAKAVVPDNPSEILAQIMLEERKQSATMRDLQREQHQLLGRVSLLSTVAGVWLALVLIGMVFACIAFLTGSSPF